MNYNELLEKYQVLLTENNKLKEEIKSLKSQLVTFKDYSISVTVGKSGPSVFKQQLIDENLPSGINNLSEPIAKIKLFMSLFQGRDDVYAKRWKNSKKTTSGYSPVCLNEWKSELCRKPKEKCTACPNKAYAKLDEKVIDAHLRGWGNLVVGIYPLCADDTCYFLAIDFDGDEWQKDITVLREVCCEFKIPVAVERSRSGKGAHAWFFFKTPISAVNARKFGAAILTYSMQKRHNIKFKSYDRLFPNQDFMPKGGLGNLIALPLQKVARENNNSVFIDDKFKPYNDQWVFLDSIKKLDEYEIKMLTLKLCGGNELGVLKKDEEEAQKLWDFNVVNLLKDDFPEELEVVKANMLFIPKEGISQRALNHLKRLAAFKNPEFHKAQAMRLPVRQIPRVISCSDETEKYLCLPRGCETELITILEDKSIKIHVLDKANNGKKIDVVFKGNLREEQPLALEKLLSYDNGVLSGTTAFGKTVVAIKLIAERKVNTLILVDKVSLVDQWRKRITEFLEINEVIPERPENEGNKRGRKKSRNIIGQLGAGKNNLSEIIDIAVIQSLNRMGEVKDCVKNYGMVIVDECHHVSAVSIEKILKNTNAKYVYGLTATPTRKDGHQPIIFMQCGPIRFRDDARKQAQKRPFEHYIIPRFTTLRIPLDKVEKEISINELYSEIVSNELRNQLIVDDVVNSYENGRNCVILTQRKAHVELLKNELSKRIPDVISVMGGMGAKENREALTQISNTPLNKQLTLVATGKYIGEGFDEPRLDTLFLAMPISWKGTLQQYAGRLHRLFEGKSEVQIYDYVDINVRMLEKMYNKRLSGYASIGYKAKGEGVVAESIDVIFNKSNFMQVFSNDIVNATKEILIVSPYVTKKSSIKMLQNLKVALGNQVKVTVITRPTEKNSIQNTLDLMKSFGVNVIFKSNIHQKFAVIDHKIIWYGSINLLGYGNVEESIMRLESPNIANELIKSIDG